MKPTLTDLAIKHGTDKWGSHYYTKHYEEHFRFLKRKPINLLEIGIGGEDKPLVGGASLRMWANWFTHKNSNIIGIDLYEKNMPFNDPRVKIHKGSQNDESFLTEISKIYGSFDLIIDDGSHLPEHIIKSFNTLFPFLREGGFYAVEDIQTSYWDKSNKKNLVMSFFKEFPDIINYEEIPDGKTPNYLNLNTGGIHFYHNLIIVKKSNNTEGSNLMPSKYCYDLIKDVESLNILKLYAHIGFSGDIYTQYPSVIATNPNRYIQGIQIITEDPILIDYFEYKAYLGDSTWTDWVRCNTFVGSKGDSLNLKGFMFKLDSEVYKIKTILLFGENEIIEIDSNELGISKNSLELRGIQIQILKN